MKLIREARTAVAGSSCCGPAGFCPCVDACKDNAPCSTFTVPCSYN